MNDELKTLREEVARLRERVAVLEARPTYLHPTPVPVWVPQTPAAPWWLHQPYTSSCDSITADTTHFLQN